MRRLLERYSFKISVAYALCAGVWIIASDSFLSLLIGKETTASTFAQIFKGLGFVVVTSGALYLLLSRLWDKQVEVEERYRLLVTHSPYAIIMHDGKTVIFANPAALKLVGATKLEQIVGKPIQDFVDPLMWEQTLNIARRTWAGEQGLYPFENRYRRLDGSLIDVEVTASPFMLNGKMVSQIVALDISERKRIAHELSESEQQYRQLVEHSPYAIAIHDGEKVLFANPAMFKLMGAEDALQDPQAMRDLIGMPITRFVHPEEWEMTFAYLQDIEHWQEGTIPMDVRFVRLDGQIVEAESTSVPIEYKGKPAFQVIALDIGQRKQAERALQASEQQYRTLMEQAPDGIFIANTQGYYVDVNSAGCRMLGYSREEILRFSLKDLTYQIDNTEFIALSQAVRNGNIIIERQLRRKDGSLLPVEISARLLADGRVQGIVRDISERKRIEAELRLKSLALESAANGIVITDVDGHIKWANPAFSTLTGYALDEAEGKSLSDLVGSGMHDPLFYKEREAIALAGEVWHGELINRRKDGTTYVEEQTLTPVRDEYNNVQYFIEIKQDITQRKQAEQALQASESKYRLLMEESPYAIAIQQHGKIIFANPAALRLLRVEALPPEGVPIQSIVHPEHWEATLDIIRKVTAGEKVSQPLESRYIRQDGSVIDVEITGTPFEYQGDLAFQLIILDISERKRAQTEMQLMARFPSENPSPIMRSTPEGVLLFANPSSQAILDFLACKVGTVLSPELSLVIRKVWESKQRTHYELTCDADIYDLFIVPIDDAGYINIYGRDITLQRQAEAELRLKSLALESAANGIVITDIDGHIKWANRSFSALTGYALDESEGKNPRELVRSGAHDQFFYKDMWDTILAGKVWRGELINRRKDGTTYVEEQTITPVRDEHNEIQHFIGIKQDITQRKHIEVELQQLNTELERRIRERTEELNVIKERLEAIVNGMNDALIYCQSNTQIIQVNPAFEQSFHISEAEVLNQPLTHLFSDDDTSRLIDSIIEVVQLRHPVRREVSAKCQDQTSFPADIILSPVTNPDDTLLGIICSVRDMSQHKLLEEQLRQVIEQQMSLNELKTRYLSMAAHDLRNPLAVIRSAVEILQGYYERLTPEARQKKYDQVLNNIELMTGMLNDILTLGYVESGKLTFQPTIVDLPLFCQSVANEMMQIKGNEQRIQLNIHCQNKICHRLWLDERLLQHIVRNLLSNALKYSPSETLITFTVECHPHEIALSFEDQGIGIPQEDQVHLFESFFRASNVKGFSGTGLGLPIVKQSVELHGGTIQVDSQQGRGSRFMVRLPLVPAPHPPPTDIPLNTL